MIHADMPCFSQYRVFLNGNEITRVCYMADAVHGVVILRHHGPQGQNFYYSYEAGKVSIEFQPQETDS